MTTPEQFAAMPVGAVVRTHHGSRWHKAESGMWETETDPGWGPYTDAELPSYATKQEKCQ